MRVNLICLYPFEGYGAKTAFKNHIKALKIQKEVSLTINKFDKRADIINTHSIDPVSFAHMLNGKHVVFSCHANPKELASVYGGSFLSKLTIKYCNNATAVVVPSLFGKKLMEKYTDTPIVPISGGVDVKNFVKDEQSREYFRKLYGINNEEKIVYCVGHTIIQKGVDTFLQVAKKMQNFNFFWAGRTLHHVIGKMDPEKLNNITQNTKFTGYLDDIRYMHCSGDIFLYPSRSEMLGIPIIEAMASGNPVIVRDIEVYEDWLHDGKNCLKAKTVNDFVDCVKQLSSDNKLRRNIIKGGYKTVKLHDLKNIGNKYLELYKELLEG